MNDKQKKRGHRLFEVTRRKGLDEKGDQTSDSLRMCLLTDDKSKLRDENFTKGYAGYLRKVLTQMRDREMDLQAGIDECNTIFQVCKWDTGGAVEWDDDI